MHRSLLRDLIAALVVIVFLALFPPIVSKEWHDRGFLFYPMGQAIDGGRLLAETLLVGSFAGIVILRQTRPKPPATQP
jgi:hypothetical protein